MVADLACLRVGEVRLALILISEVFPLAVDESLDEGLNEVLLPLFAVRSVCVEFCR